MQGHFAEAQALEHALLVGELATTTESAQWFLERHRDDSYPPEWKPQIDAMMTWATRTASAHTVDDAAVSIANLSAACGACHQDKGAKLVFESVHEPPLDEQMERYRFAVDRMWEGLVAASDESWSRGASAYADVVTCEPLGAAEEKEPFHREACNSLLAASANASAAKSRADRTAAFAEVARACASCHGAPAQ